MPAGEMGDRTQIRKLTEVGRYALGVDWGDGHESILPFRAIRVACPCETCVAQPIDGATAAPPVLQATGVEVLGDASVFVRYADGHETILLTEELRDLCRCAHCVPEPNYPVSGQ